MSRLRLSLVAGFLIGAAACALRTSTPAPVLPRTVTAADSARGRLIAAYITPGDSDSGVKVAPHMGLAKYPIDEQASRVDGGAVVVFVIDSTGRVMQGSLTVVVRSPEIDFAKSACEYLAQTEFEFTTLPRRTFVMMPFTFSSGGPVRLPARETLALLWGMTTEERVAWLAGCPSCAEIRSPRRGTGTP